jgi:MFS family permease
VIFLTLYIDLVGFSIIFPLFPAILKYYLAVDGQAGAVGWLLAQSQAGARLLHLQSNFEAVLFGGVLSSLYAFLQFIFAPMWGALSDRIGRRHVLFNTVAGTALSYAVWVFSGSFWLFIAARLVGGAFSGNLSVATAAVADVTTREERSRAMGIVGAAFGLGLVTGPVIGALTASIDLTAHFPGLARFGVNPFSVPALISLAMSVLNVVWVAARFHETLPRDARDAAQAARRSAERRVRHPFRAIFALTNPGVRLVNLLAFLYALAFCGMEFSLTFLADERFQYTPRQNGMLIGFLGVFSIITQGVIVRRLYKKMSETRVLFAGLVASSIALLVIGLSAAPWQLYIGLALVAIGSGLINPSSSGLISLYSETHEQGRVLGIFRSLGSLARAVTPIVAGVMFAIPGWRMLTAGWSVFVAGAALTVACLWLCAKLPEPVKVEKTAAG